MTHGTHTKVWVPLVAILVAASDGGCQDVQTNHLRQEVQHAVVAGASGELAPAVPSGVAALSALPAPVARPSLSIQVPTGHMEGAAAEARMVVPEDRDHRNTGASRLGERYGVVWTDPSASTVYFARLDAQGHPEGGATVVHHAVEEEEGIASPVVMASSDGYGIAWVDAENGRVRFRRLDANGVLQGHSSIVHEGLEAPRVTRLVWTGQEFGLAVGQWRGVYFARVGEDGVRIGDGVLIDEGTAVGSLDGIDWDGRGYTVSWSQHHDGTATHMRQRVGGDGHRQGGAAVMGAINRPAAMRNTTRMM